MPAAPSGADSPRAGFTLLELLVVISIAALLAGLVLGVGRRASEAGRTGRARAELAVLAAALDHYRRSQGDYPQLASEAGLLPSLLGRLGPAQQPANGPALIELARFTVGDGRDPDADAAARLVDPWGRPYRYAYRSTAPWKNPGFVLFSDGPDGEAAPTLLPGGYHDDADARNLDNIVAGQD